MSFFMEVEVEDLTWDRARDLARKCSPAHGLSVVKPRRGLRRRRGPQKLVISDYYGGESILADDADWSAPAWSMRPEGLAKLEVTLRCLCRNIPEGFGFTAAPRVGERIDHEHRLSCAELIDLVRRSALNGRTRYRVTASDRRIPEELELAEEDVLVLGYVSDLYVLLGAVDEVMPKDAILYVEGTSIVPEVSQLLRARHAQEWEDIRPHTAMPTPKAFHLPLTGTNLKEFRGIADHYAEPEVCDHLVVYQDGRVLLKAHDAGAGYVEVNRKLPEKMINHLKDSLGGAMK